MQRPAMTAKLRLHAGQQGMNRSVKPIVSWSSVPCTRYKDACVGISCFDGRVMACRDACDYR